MSRFWIPHPFRLWAQLPTCWTQQLKCTRQGAIKEPALFRPELNTPPSPRSLVCCRPPQPGGNCIAVSPLLMSCQRNCFTVWPLVFQTSALVKDPRRPDERWCMHVFLPVRLRVWWRQDKYVSPLMLPVALVSSVFYIYVYIFLHILKRSSSLHHLKSSSWVNWIVHKSAGVWGTSVQGQLDVRSVRKPRIQHGLHVMSVLSRKFHFLLLVVWKNNRWIKSLARWS